MTSLLSLPKVRWGALYQQDFGTEYLKPTRIMATLQQVDELFLPGDAMFDNDGFYQGPLKYHDGAPKLEGRTTSGDFLSAS